MKKMFLMACLIGLFTNFNYSIDIQSVTLERIDSAYEVSSFLANNEGELFLFSSGEGKIFKFNKNGEFDKSFCRFGLGPGEIARVLYLFHNPKNNYLYLPEFFSSQKKVTMYDSDGIDKGTFDLDMPSQQMDKISNLAFCKDGSFYVSLNERIGWKSIGKFYTTQEKISIKYFNEKRQFRTDIFKTTMDDEFSNAPRYGGPRIFFRPSILTKLTHDDNILVAKTDENFFTVFNQSGDKIETINLDIQKDKLSRKEFESLKDIVVGNLRDPRMKYLAENMIKLGYKPIYANIFLQKENIILVRIAQRDENYSIQDSRLIYFTWSGKKLGSRKVEGEILNVNNGRIFVKLTDIDGTEQFKILDDTH